MSLYTLKLNQQPRKLGGNTTKKSYSTNISIVIHYFRKSYAIEWDYFISNTHIR